MKLSLKFLILFLFVSEIGFAQLTMVRKWTATVDAMWNQNAKRVLTDRHLNVYAICEYYNGSTNKIVVIKRNTNGKNLFQTVIKNNSTSQEMDVFAAYMDADDNIYVLARTFKNTHDSASLLVAKMDTTGKIIWKQNYIEPSSTEYLKHSASHVSKDGNLFFASYKKSDYDNALKYGYGAYDAYLLKYSSGGDLEWQLNIDHDTLFDEINGIVTDDAGNIYITGFGGEEYNDITHKLISPFFLYKLDAKGNYIWKFRINEQTTQEWGFSLKYDNNGYLYSLSKIEKDSGFVLRKFDSAGNLIWVNKEYYSQKKPYHKLAGLATDFSESVYVIAGDNKDDFGDAGAMQVLRYDTSGDFKWKNEYRTISSAKDIFVKALVDNNGNLVIGGYTFDSTKTSMASVSQLIYGVKQNGDLFWRTTWSSGWRDEISDMTLDAAGNAYLSGKLFNSYPDYVITKYAFEDTRKLNVTSFAYKALAGSNIKLNFSATNISCLKIHYSADSGKTWTLVADNVSGKDNSYNWKVPDTASVFSKLRFTDCSDSTFYKETILFKIYKPRKITISAPEKNEKIIAGTKYSIKFTAENLTCINLIYTIDSGKNWVTIVRNLSATNTSYLWSVPDTVSKGCFIVITDCKDSLFYSATNWFEIYRKPQREIIVSDPAKNTQILAASSFTINFTSKNINCLDLYYSLDSGKIWQTITSGLSADSTNYVWAVPDTISNNSKIKIADCDDSTFYTVSDLFEIYRTVGVQKIQQSQLKIYPNPTTGHFYIENSGFSSRSNLTITNVSGQIVYSNTLNNPGNIIHISMPEKMPSGVYIISIKDDIQIKYTRISYVK